MPDGVDTQPAFTGPKYGYRVASLGYHEPTSEYFFRYTDVVAQLRKYSASSHK